MAPVSSMRILLGGLASVTVVEAAVENSASIPVPGSVAVAPLAPAVPDVAPARLPALYECDVEKENWEVAWTPDWKAWCCENDDSKRGCPPTTTVTTTTTTTTLDEKLAAETACNSSCTLDGATFSCSARIHWASEHTFKEKENPCEAAVDLVRSECDACSKCTIEAFGCSAEEGEDEDAQEKSGAHPEPQHEVPDEKDERETREGKEKQHEVASESKEETKSESGKSVDEKDVDLKADTTVDTDASKVVGLGPQIDANQESQDGADGQVQGEDASEGEQHDKSEKSSGDAAKEQEHAEPKEQPAEATAQATMNLRKALAEKFEEPVSRLGMSSPPASSASLRSSVLDGLWMALMSGAALAIATSTYKFVARHRAAAEHELMGVDGAMEEFLQDDEEVGVDEVQE